MLVLKALSRHRATASLMVFQVAAVLAIVVNCIFVIGVAVVAAGESLGIDEENIGIIQSVGVVGAMGASTQANNLTALARVPGVTHASFGPVPLRGTSHVNLTKDGLAGTGVSAVIYRGAGDYQSTLGIRLIEGKGLEQNVLPPAAMSDPEWPAVISDSLRERLFGNSPAVGQLMRAGQQRFRVVGVMHDVASALPVRATDRMTMLTAQLPASSDIGGIYLIRTAPGEVARALPFALATMRELNPGHVQPLVSTFHELRAKRAARSNSLAYSLSVVVGILVLITAFGIGSQTAHWVRQRRTSIGIRRALGARPVDIVSYFMTENLILTAVGLCLGTVGALVVNRVGMARLNLPPVSPGLIVVSVIGVAVVSLGCAVFPALRASRVAPAEAVRSL